MTADQLRAFKHKVPFEPIRIHMNNGDRFDVADPESLVLPQGWQTDAIVAFPNGNFTFVYLRNISHVSSSGGFPRMKGRRPKGGRGGDEE